MHHMLPSRPLLIAQVLLDLLELRQHIGVIRAVDVPREKHPSHRHHAFPDHATMLNRWRVKALQHIRVRPQRQPDKLLNLPVAFLMLVLQLLRHPRQSPLHACRRQIESPSIRIRRSSLQPIRPRPHNALQLHTPPQHTTIHLKRNRPLHMLLNRQLLPPKLPRISIRKPHQISLPRSRHPAHHFTHAPICPHHHARPFRNH